MVDVRTVFTNLAGLVWVALRSFAGTLLFMLVLGLTAAGVSYYVLSEHPGYGVLAAVLALVEFVAAGFFLGVKRAIAGALAHGLRTLRLGTAAVRVVFERLLGVSAEKEAGGKGNWAERGAAVVPLAQAEERLSQVIRDLVKAPPDGAGLAGWFRLRLQKMLLGLLQKVTLARFREAGDQKGSVDLRKVRADLETRVDDLLLDRVASGVNGLTALVLAGLLAVAGLQTYGLRTLAASRAEAPSLPEKMEPAPTTSTGNLQVLSS